MKGPRKAIRAHAGSLSVCRYDVACHRFFNTLLERSAAKSSARELGRIISGEGKALWKTERATGRWLLFVSGLCIHDSVQGFALAAAGRSLCFLKNAMIGLPQREQNEYVGHSIPATISSCRFLISFLQRSHLRMSIDQKQITYALVAAVSNLAMRASCFSSRSSWRRSCSARAISSARWS